MRRRNETACAEGKERYRGARPGRIGTAGKKVRRITAGKEKLCHCV
ncbi:hypothetical protein BRYFOR_07985 [Marvinbryantia formatexigens DSM 14469]|uniref:Uncharacterized protein n=1 Tax=Marvinbryantia formatexigens DSM 14469 TaxID=478749 RepID=C6LH75_9FIRM|nr:hypothetical protein BRYFOR_07985 [Marvinbryantia formatexigens DSM 14469]